MQACNSSYQNNTDAFIVHLQIISFIGGYAEIYYCPPYGMPLSRLALC